MNKTEAEISIKRIQSEASKLETSALITLFELDLSLVLENQGIISNTTNNFFYFHNNNKLIATSIKSKNKEYLLCPIEATDFETSSQGTLPTPRLRITVSSQGTASLSLLKAQIRLLGDLVGCKVTRRRTFAKFLIDANFNVHNRPNTQEIDELAELPPDIWYINRKSNENKFMIEYELNSILDLENIELPRRQMIAKRCNLNYRGEGCVYEYGGNGFSISSRKNDDIHGEFTILPEQAPPVATEEDKLISDIIGVPIGNKREQYNFGMSFNIGEHTYIESNGLKYYFVAKRNGILNPPPNATDWIADKCSKCIKGCKLRWSTINPVGSVIVGNSGLTKGELPFGGFLALDRIR